MPKGICPLCGSRTIQTAENAAVCPYCEASVQVLKQVTIIHPRGAAR
ncbi:MAG TPA: hypothetical protein V6D47_17025 [Oscillatoriaceae cyanobacterium]